MVERPRWWRGGHRRSEPGGRAFPWRAPRHELLLLCLVGLVVFLPVYSTNPQDSAHICLSEALTQGRLTADACLSDGFDRSSRGGHLYSDKAPGLAVVEIPAVEAIGVGAAPERWPGFYLQLWGIRLLSTGLGFLLCAFLVGRVGEGLAPGLGGPALVAFSLGSLVAPFAASGFSHDLSAGLALSAFLLAWRRRPLLAGLAAGAAVLSDYECGLALAIVAVYVAYRELRSLVPYLLGVVPSAVVLGLYDWAAFGAPWHLSYRYVDNIYVDDQSSGFFGIAVPHAFQAVEVFAGPGGLLVLSPVLVAAALGLVQLARTWRAEAIVCAAVAAVFVVLNCGYFLPYGGVSPGPRFLIPCLPFLALGLGPAFARYPRTTAAAAAVSVLSTIAVMLVWTSDQPLRQAIWGELARIPVQGGSSRYVHDLTRTALSEVGIGKAGGAAIVAAGALAACLLAFRSVERAKVTSTGFRAGRRPLRSVVVLVACAYVVVAADVSAVFAYPYGNRTAGKAIEIADIETTIQATRTTAALGDEVDFTVTVNYLGNTIAKKLFLTIQLASGMHLLGAPYYTIGSGCRGTTTIVCNLDYLPAFHSTQIKLGVTMSEAGSQSISASTTTDGIPGYSHPKLTIESTSP